MHMPFQNNPRSLRSASADNPLITAEKLIGNRTCHDETKGHSTSKFINRSLERLFGILAVMFIMPLWLHAQSVEGLVRDAQTRQALEGATVYHPESGSRSRNWE